MHVLEIIIVMAIAAALVWPFLVRRSQLHVSIAPEIDKESERKDGEQEHRLENSSEPLTRRNEDPRYAEYLAQQRQRLEHATRDPIVTPSWNTPSASTPVLVVSSERVVADTIATILTQRGYPAKAAYDGTEALAKARELQPWFVLSDVMMPGMHGVEAGIRIRRAQPDCEILLFSGADCSDLLSIAAELGFRFEIRASPIHPQDLFDRISKAKAERLRYVEQLEQHKEMFRRAAEDPIVSGPSSVPVEPSPVLIVASERMIADTLTIILKQHGYPAATAYNGDEAVTKARELRPWFVLSDVIMPRMNGIEAAIRIRREHPDCQILLFSGQAATCDLLQIARELGYEFRIVSMPIHPQDLLAKIKEANAGRQPRTNT